MCATAFSEHCTTFFVWQMPLLTFILKEPAAILPWSLWLPDFWNLQFQSQIWVLLMVKELNIACSEGLLTLEEKSFYMEDLIFFVV